MSDDLRYPHYAQHRDRRRPVGVRRYIAENEAAYAALVGAGVCLFLSAVAAYFWGVM
jgi:hypothetical protein